MNKKRILWITQTALFIALLISSQYLTSFIGNTLITGSIVNMILIISVMTCGYASGSVVALISPVFAKLLGIGPFWTIIPFIMLGNLVIITVWHFIGKRGSGVRQIYVFRLSALILGAALKYLALFVGVTKIAVPMFMALNEKQTANIATLFSIHQLITASIGGALAFIILPLLEKALKRR